MHPHVSSRDSQAKTSGVVAKVILVVIAIITLVLNVRFHSRIMDFVDYVEPDWTPEMTAFNSFINVCTLVLMILFGLFLVTLVFKKKAIGFSVIVVTFMVGITVACFIQEPYSGSYKEYRNTQVASLEPDHLEEYLSDSKGDMHNLDSSVFPHV